MYIKIYFDDKPLFLCNEMDPAIEPFLHHDDAIFIDELDAHTIKSMIHEMQQENVHAGVFLHPDFDKLKKEFFKKFTVIQAAGGAVFNEETELLLIFRRGFWDLPKGKLDPGESLAACALREVQEETNIQNLKLMDFLGTTYHTYHEGTRFILKESHWYRMSAPSAQNLVPQIEEDITQIEWKTPEKAKEYFPRMYPSIREVVLAVG